MKHHTSNAEDNSTGNASSLPAVTAAFSGYKPPRNVVADVRRMLESVPEQYLHGLSEIVLTNTGALSRNRRRGVAISRGRKLRLRQIRGLYHPAFNNRNAWIEIFVDNTFRHHLEWYWKLIPILFEMQISDVLFHELGHHVHTIRPEFREREDVADVWKARLQREYHRKRYVWQRRIFRGLGFGWLFRHWGDHANDWMLAKGYISRAEYDESRRLQSGPPTWI